MKCQRGSDSAMALFDPGTIPSIKLDYEFISSNQRYCENGLWNPV